MNNTYSDEEIDNDIKNMMSVLGLSSELQLAQFLKISSTTITKWKKRGNIPEKYKTIVKDTITLRADASSIIDEVHVSVQEVMEVLGSKKESRWIYTYKKKNPHLYQIIEDGIKVEKARAAKLL